MANEELAAIDNDMRSLAGLLMQAADREDIATMRQDIYLAITDLQEGAERISRVLSENAAMREIVQAVADDHMHRWEAVDPQEVWACQVCHIDSQDYAEEVQTKARALLASEGKAAE